MSVQCLYCQRQIKGQQLDGNDRPRKRSNSGWLLFFSLLTTLIFIVGTALFIREQGSGRSLTESPLALGLMTFGLAGYLVVRVMTWMRRWS